MMLKRYPALAAIILSLFLVACVPPVPKHAAWTVPTAEVSRWSAEYIENGETLPLTLVIMADEEPGPARLVALSAFGSVVGDCLMTDDLKHCEGPRNTEKLMGRLIEAVWAMPKTKAPETFEYRPANASKWSVRLKRLAVQ
ncbi:MAG: hypothetical protein LBV79_10505 [Candidatus Adiutrix sp.]|jgi:hypothetical protein|nr:hypothetical protein [Candidatus Adiutrix sp.]